VDCDTIGGLFIEVVVLCAAVEYDVERVWSVTCGRFLGGDDRILCVCCICSKFDLVVGCVFTI
jgi:hypothetical protein